MHFGFDDDQLAVRDAVSAFLEKRADLTYLQAAWTDPAGERTWSVWSELAAMGVPGLLVPESMGGSGFDWVTMALVLTEAGRAALPLPLMETAAIAVPLLQAAGDPAGIMASLLSGDLILTVSAGTGGLAPASSRADWFLLATEDGSRLYPREHVEIAPEVSVDRTRDLARITPTGAGHLLERPPSVPDIAEAGAVGSAALLVGLGRALVAMTVDYVKDRKQFGVPVGSFQAVKHHLADAAMQVEFAAPAVWAAAYELSRPDSEPDGRRRSVSLAKAMASDAAAVAARQALQCHGAMGYTDDYHLHIWLKRAWCLAAAYGTSRQHRRRIGVSLGVDG